MHLHADLAFFAKVAGTTLPDPSDPHYELLLQAQANAELKRRDARALAEGDLYYFATEILGYHDFHEPLHRPLCEFIQQPTKQLTLLPRGHFKSTIISVSYPLWLLVRFPDTRILIANATLDNPKKWVQEQLAHLRGNQVFRWLFPESCPSKDEAEQFGFVASFTVPNRTATWGQVSLIPLVPDVESPALQAGGRPLTSSSSSVPGAFESKPGSSCAHRSGSSDAR